MSKSLGEILADAIECAEKRIKPFREKWHKAREARYRAQEREDAAWARVEAEHQKMREERE